MLEFDVLIVGGGAAGMSAAVSAKEEGCESILLVESREYLGGILPQCIHNGFGNGLTGPEYEKEIEKRFLKSGCEYMLGSSVLRIDGDKKAYVSTRSGIIAVKFAALILAAGCTEIPFGALGIAGTRPAGIYGAGQAQELINLMGKSIGKNAVIIGCGDLGMIMARRLTLSGVKVLAVVEKGPGHNGLARNYRDCIEKYGISVIYNKTVAEIRGAERISSVRLSDGREIFCDTLLVAAGLKCDRTLERGHEKADWLFMCGNCEKVHDMVESAVTQAQKTGKEVYSYLT